MKCISKKCIVILLLITTLISTGCGSSKYTIEYSPESKISSANVLPGASNEKLEAFAADLCVVKEDKLLDSVDMSKATAAVLFDIDENQIVFSKNANQVMYPASLTKILTALVALKNASLNQVLTATESVYVSESGAQLCGLKPGDNMTLDQALHILLMYSANDAALLIAENVGGTVENFVQMMNDEAKRLGATNSNFVNPHGLSNDEHYTTAYDLYLIFNEAIKYDEITEIIHMTSYSTSFYDAEGKTKDISIGTTNLFLKGNYEYPDNVTIIGGKTGTTNAAGHCLMLLSKDTYGQSYISIILCAEARDVLYGEMADLLEEIKK